MSLNYGTLKSKVLADAHRGDLTGEVAGFIRAAEGVIARRLRCAEMIKRVNLDDTDRASTSTGIYSLPTDYLEQRALYTSAGIPLENVSLSELRDVIAGAPVRHYTILSSSEIEFRGVPGESAEIELLYFARPTSLSDDADTNDILTRHEVIYVQAALSELYLFTQDLELAQAAGQIADAAIENLNEQAGRLLGGARTEGGYNLSSWGSY